GDLVALLDDRGHLGLGGVERALRTALDGDVADRAVAADRVLHGCQRGDHDVVLVLDAVGALWLGLADDLEARAVDAYRLADRVGTAEEVLDDGRAEHDDA